MKPNKDNAIIGLIQEGIQRYKLNSPTDQIEESHIDELVELASDILGDTQRNVMLQLPKEKKIQLILSLVVLNIN
jgi:hypothetical protein